MGKGGEGGREEKGEGGGGGRGDLTMSRATWAHPQSDPPTPPQPPSLVTPVPSSLQRHTAIRQ
jgi:hypothetical protein